MIQNTLIVPKKAEITTLDLGFFMTVEFANHVRNDAHDFMFVAASFRIHPEGIDTARELAYKLLEACDRLEERQ